LCNAPPEEEGGKPKQPNCIKKNNAYTSLATDKFQLLDMMQYLAPGSSYETFVKGYAPTVELAKCPFPYSWLDSVERLDEGLPEQYCFYNDLKDEELSLEEYEKVKQIWVEKKFTTMGEYLQFYNEVDVRGFVVAADNYKNWWHEQNIDPFKQGM
jgi:hypothetical protein